MKKLKSLFLLLVIFVMIAITPQSVWALGGSGTSSSPYTIANAADLVAFANKVNGTEQGAYGKLTADITLTSAWTAMGTSSKPYTGTFDGQGHKISGFSMEGYTKVNAGFFGYVNNATIKNFTLNGTMTSSTQITGGENDCSGAVVGRAMGSSTIQDIVSNVNIKLTKAQKHLGGVVGAIEGSTVVKGCTYTGTLNAGPSSDCIGGIVGFAPASCSGSIFYCFFNGTLSSSSSTPTMGGILGYTNDESNNFGGVRNCYSCGTFSFGASDYKYVNAIVGRIRNRATTTINNTYLSGIATRACNTDGPSIPASNKAITISVTAGSNGTVSKSYVNPTSTAATQLKVVATPNANYYLSSWSDGGAQTHNVALTDNVDVMAYFNINPTITVKVASGQSAMGTVSGGGQYTYKSKQTITATPKPHYHFVKWNDGNTSASRQITVTEDKTYTATFAIDQHTITLFTKGGSGSYSGEGTYDYNTKLTISATPHYGYHFVKWDDGVTTTSRQITVTGDETYTAFFAPNQYTITVEIDGGPGTTHGSGTYDYGTNVDISVTPDEHYFIDYWLDARANSSSTRRISVSGDATFKAHLLPKSYTLTARSNDINRGCVFGNLQGTYVYLTEVIIEARPENNYHFADWSDGVTENPRTISMTGDLTLTANFNPNPYTITVEASNSEYGIVSGSGTYDYNTKLTISATPNPGYHFAKWDDGVTTTSRQITVTGNTTYTALFDPNTYTITTATNNQNRGFVLGEGRYKYGETITLFAVPETDYEFVQWSDGNTQRERKVTITGDATYTAIFELCLKPWAVLYNSTLTFYYDNIERPGTRYEVPLTSGNPWGVNLYNARSIYHVVFDDSFAEVRPTNTSEWFRNCENMEDITGLDNLNTESVTNMSYMFSGCSRLTSLDLSTFHTDSVTDMYQMFYNCSSLTSLDLSTFHTDSVTNMSGMFSGCSRLTSLDLSTFHTDSVTNMSGMFRGCSRLTSLDLSTFNTDSVTDMSYMFQNCSSLTSLNLSSFNTGSVTNMSYMFQNCSKLTSLDLSSFNTGRVTDMSYMFQNCSKLTSLDLSSFNTGSVTNMCVMFSSCVRLLSLTIGNFDMQKVNNCVGMFDACTLLNTLTLKSIPFLKDGTFNTKFSGVGKTVNYALELNDNSIVYDGTNYLPSATSVLTSTYTREMSNAWGTVVVPFPITYNANNGNNKLYYLKSVNGEEVYFQEYSDGAIIPAGRPMAVKAVGSRNASGKYEIVLEGNGTINTNITVYGDMDGTYTLLEEQTDIYFIAQNAFWLAEDPITIAPFRAWFTINNDHPDTGDPDYVEPDPEPNPDEPDEPDDDYELNHDAAPARLRIVEVSNNEQVATWLDATAAAAEAKAQKVMIDGQMFILKNGQMFDICGRKVK